MKTAAELLAMGIDLAHVENLIANGVLERVGNDAFEPGIGLDWSYIPDMYNELCGDDSE
jgi:hypothetical protein